MKVTKNGKERMNEKIGIPKKSLERQFKLALERGFQHNETKGNLFKWITKVSLSEKYARKCIVYNNHLFVTDNNETLITVLKIPSNLTKDIKVLTKKKA